MVKKQEFTKILVANRGEIAVRIMRSAKDLGIKVVAVYEETDKDTCHVMRADEAVCIGTGPRKDYLNIQGIITAARKSGAQAIHPGYGFLAENPDFPKACTSAGISFIGPPPEVIRDLGSKVIARRLAQEADIPVIPATEALPSGEKGEQEALVFASTHGYPIMVKAVAGGGGRGIRKYRDEGSLIRGLNQSRSEALMAFGNDAVYLEKCLEYVKHVEVQILADHYGHVVHLGTRNCSIQRRHQKLIEIAPAGLDATLTEKILAAAVNIAKAANYLSAGTVEMLVEPDGNFYFLEMNMRIQVEHTVTEMITGIDIVREQLLIAQGEPISFSQDQVIERGCAIELRINAEDPRNNFLADPGLVRVYLPSGGPGVRLDEAVYQGFEIPRYYDSMMVKLTVFGFTWKEAVQRLSRVLEGFLIIGVKTTIPYFQKIVQEPDFIEKKFDTTYVDTHPGLLKYQEEEKEEYKIALLIAEIHANGYNPYAR